MKTISLKHYILSVCAAAAMLAGCGGSTQLQTLRPDARWQRDCLKAGRVAKFRDA